MAKLDTPITLTIDDSTVATALRWALEIQIDIESDTLTDDNPHTADEIRAWASQSDEYINSELRKMNDRVHERVDRVAALKLILSHLP